MNVNPNGPGNGGCGDVQGKPSHGPFGRHTRPTNVNP